jgi:hypothetical protein
MLSDRVNSLRGKRNNENKTVTSIVMVMKEMGWSYDQMINTPVSSFVVILDELGKDAERQNKAAKKR